MYSLQELANCPFKLEIKTGRAVLISVYNDDTITADTVLYPDQIIVALAHKLLVDMGLDSNSLLLTFRWMLPALTNWDWDNNQPIALNISDTRYVTLVGAKLRSKIFDYVDGVEVIGVPPTPVIVVSVNLVKLLSIGS